MDIRKDNIFWSLGIFGIVLFALIIVLLLYYVIKLLRNRVEKFKVLEKFLAKKLFYSSGIRYLITSSLKLCYTCFVFLVYVGISFKSWNSSLNAVVNIIILCVLIIWPFFLTLFLMGNREHLDDKEFQEKFYSMYQGIKTDGYMKLNFGNRDSCFLYNVFFVLRRAIIVIFLVLYFKTK